MLDICELAVKILCFTECMTYQSYGLKFSYSITDNYLQHLYIVNNKQKKEKKPMELSKTHKFKHTTSGHKIDCNTFKINFNLLDFIIDFCKARSNKPEVC